MTYMFSGYILTRCGRVFYSQGWAVKTTKWKIRYVYNHSWLYPSQIGKIQQPNNILSTQRNNKTLSTNSHNTYNLRTIR